MKYVILVSKHVDGFCLWDSRYTNYDVASSGNKTNVVEKVHRPAKNMAWEWEFIIRFGTGIKMAM